VTFAFAPPRIWSVGRSCTGAVGVGVPVGDCTPDGLVTGDGKVDMGDALFIAQYLAHMRQLTPEQLALADVNQNGIVDIGDAMFIAQYAAHKRASLPVARSQRTVYVKFKYLPAGTWSDVYSAAIILDTTLPLGSIIINNNAPYAKSNQVTLTLSASDASGLSQMQFSNDNQVWSTPETYATTKTWVLITGDGQKTVYAKFSDKAGNWSNIVYAKIILDTTIPQIGSLTPLNYATFYENNTISISPTVNNPNSGSLEYQFSIDEAIKQPWSGQSKYDWQGVSGIHNIKVEVRNIAGQDSKQVEICVFKNPVRPPD